MFNHLDNNARRNFTQEYDFVRQSHKYCKTKKINKNLHNFYQTRVDTKFFVSQNILQELTNFFEGLFNATSEKNIIFFLTNKEGCVTYIYSSEQTIDDAKHNLNLTIGSSFNEDHIGTNAVDLSIKTSRPSIVIKKQHYCEILHELVTLAQPIGEFLGDSNYMGILASNKKAIKEYSILLNLSSYFLSHILQRKNELPNKKTKLTLRQKEVLSKYSNGFTYKEIAKSLNLASFKTVEDHLDAIKHKLSANTRRECIKKALLYGLLSHEA